MVGEQDTSECLEYELGDVNMDYEIDILDIVFIVNFILGFSEFSELQIQLSDINVDNSIDILDIISIVYLILE